MEYGFKNGFDEQDDQRKRHCDVFEEVAVVAHYLLHLGLLEKIVQEVRFSRKRFGTYDTIDFLCVLIGYALSGEATLKGFYERLTPFATPFMLLFGRSELPSRAALSRFLKALDQATVEALRTLFQKDLVARPLTDSGKTTGGLWDRRGEQWQVFDIDGTRKTARQRALPATPDLPPAHRRMDAVCAPGYTGHKRGEVVRTRTTIRAARIPSSGWEPSAILAMVIIEVISCVQQLSLPDTSPASTSLCIGLSSDWMANMAIMLW